MRAFILLVIAACGSTKRTSEPVGNRAAPPPKPTCTDERTEPLARQLAARWNTTRVSIVRCTPGLFPTPGFFVEAVDGDAHYTGIIDLENSELVPIALEVKREVAADVVACATVDLDGDGSDEIVETWRAQLPGSERSDSWLEVRRVESRGLETIKGPHTSVYHPELGGCNAELRLAGKTIVVDVGSYVGIPPSNCLTVGTHSFALDHGAIIEINATRISRR